MKRWIAAAGTAAHALLAPAVTVAATALTDPNGTSLESAAKPREQHRPDGRTKPDRACVGRCRSSPRLQARLQGSGRRPGDRHRCRAPRQSCRSEHAAEHRLPALRVRVRRREFAPRDALLSLGLRPRAADLPHRHAAPESERDSTAGSRLCRSVGSSRRWSGSALPPTAWLDPLVPWYVRDLGVPLAGATLLGCCASRVDRFTSRRSRYCVTCCTPPARRAQAAPAGERVLAAAGGGVAPGRFGRSVSFPALPRTRGRARGSPAPACRVVAAGAAPTSRCTRSQGSADALPCSSSAPVPCSRSARD